MRDTSDPMITVDGLTKTFPGGIEAVSDFSAVVARQEVVVIMGPSGSGKSTVLRCLNGLEEPDAGRIVVDGIPAPASSSRAARAASAHPTTAIPACSQT